MRASRYAALRNVLIILVLWEVVGRLKLVAGGALPGFTEILQRLWVDRADYPAHILATLEGAFLGFLAGNAVAIAAGIVFVLLPWTLRLMRGVNIAIFALPPIALAPILVITFSGMTPRVVLAAIGCYFVTMTATVIGLTQVDARAVDVVRAYGGGRFDILRLVQLRSALPAILGGLRVAAPNAVLGAILAEFGGGGRWGLGNYLLGSLGRGEPARLWGIGLVATAIAGLAYALFAVVSARITGATRAVTVAPSAPPALGRAARSAGAEAVLLLASIMLPFLLWWLLIEALDVPRLIAKSPWGVFEYLFLLDSSPNAQMRLAQALLQTLPITLVGMAAGLGGAFLLAISSRVFPQFTRAFMPVALFTQTMPLVALTPLLVLVFGRGFSVTLWITISVTFFPAFVTMAQGIALVPRAALDVPRAYGASAWKEMRLVSIPASLPYLFAAARLTAPRALLGVMIAEWLATGTGLGNLLNQSRGYLDYGMIWVVAFVSVLVSMVLYQIIVLAERRVLGRLGMRSSE